MIPNTLVLIGLDGHQRIQSSNPTPRKGDKFFQDYLLNSFFKVVSVCQLLRGTRSDMKYYTNKSAKPRSRKQSIERKYNAGWEWMKKGKTEINGDVL